MIRDVSYASGMAPPGYRCHRCCVHGVKLWREYQTFGLVALWCASCACRVQGLEDIVDEKGLRLCRPGSARRTSSIGNLVPAVPDQEGVGFWGVTSIPQAGFNWWEDLPTRRTE